MSQNRLLVVIVLSFFTLSSFASIFKKKITLPQTSIQLFNDSAIDSSLLNLNLSVVCARAEFPFRSIDILEGKDGWFKACSDDTVLINKMAAKEDGSFVFQPETVELRNDGIASIFINVGIKGKEYFISSTNWYDILKLTNSATSQDHQPGFYSRDLQNNLKNLNGKTLHLIGLSDGLIESNGIQRAFEKIEDKYLPFAWIEYQVYFSTDKFFRENVFKLGSGGDIYPKDKEGQRILGNKFFLRLKEKVAVVELENNIQSGYIKLVLRSNANNDFINPPYKLEKIVPVSFDHGKWPEELHTID